MKKDQRIWLVIIILAAVCLLVVPFPRPHWAVDLLILMLLALGSFMFIIEED